MHRCLPNQTAKQLEHKITYCYSMKWVNMHYHKMYQQQIVLTMERPIHCLLLERSRSNIIRMGKRVSLSPLQLWFHCASFQDSGSTSVSVLPQCQN